MSGHVALDSDTGLLQISFPYSPTLVELVKRLPGRRWDPLQKIWTAPASAAGEVVRRLGSRGFTFAPEVHQKAGQEPAESPGSVPAAAMTVSQLNQAARVALGKAFPSPLWLVAELNRFQVRGSGHGYLELVEKSEEREGVAASVSAVVFADTLRAITDRLADAGGLELADGLEVRVLVQPDLYPGRGQFQVQIRDIDPTFTLGRLAARREEILRELTRQGVLERNLDLPWPRLPLRVALVTSWETNAFSDFTGVLEHSGWGFRVDVIDVRVQGESLERSVVRALGWFASRAEEYDLLAIVRGGGSPADLAWFDNLQVALAVARHPLKAVIGIGHTGDQGVLDRIAHSCRTPTAAAEALVERVALEAGALETCRDALLEGMRRRLQEERFTLGSSTRRLGLALRARLREELTHLHHLQGRLASGAGARLRLESGHLAGAATQLHRLTRHVTDRERERLAFLERQVAGLHPARTLERGYALIRNSKGDVLRGAAGVRVDDTVTIELRDGALAARVTDRKMAKLAELAEEGHEEEEQERR